MWYFILFLKWMFLQLSGFLRTKNKGINNQQHLSLVIIYLQRPTNVISSKLKWDCVFVLNDRYSRVESVTYSFPLLCFQWSICCFPPSIKPVRTAVCWESQWRGSLCSHTARLSLSPAATLRVRTHTHTHCAVSGLYISNLTLFCPISACSWNHSERAGL